MTYSFKSQADLLTALSGSIYSFEGATLKATTPPVGASDTRVATTQWVSAALGLSPSPPVVLAANGLSVTYSGGTVINGLTTLPIYITGSSTPIAVGASSTEYVWVRYLDSAVVVSTVSPNNNLGTLIATVITNATSIVSVIGNTNATGWAPINSPAFSGVVTVPNPPLNDNSNKAPTTSWVRSLVQSNLVGSDFPTLSITSTGTGVQWSAGSVSLTGTEYVIIGGQYTFSTSTNGVMSVYALVVGGTTTVLVSATAPTSPNVLLGTVSVSSGVIGQVTLPSTVGFAPIASPTFTGNPQAPTPAVGDRDSSIATTGWVVDMVTTKMVVGFGGYVTYLP
ncbi:hypothetical protein [Microcoleus phage My-WqHQDG]|nr:hypothetical protein [Microcoleus phage My-WqHQDG]